MKAVPFQNHEFRNEVARITKRVLCPFVRERETLIYFFSGFLAK